MKQAAGSTPMPAAEILRRVEDGLADEIRRMLEDGVVPAAEDIDLCLILGAGWPFIDGGASPYLDRVGASERVFGGTFHTPPIRGDRQQLSARHPRRGGRELRRAQAARLSVETVGRRRRDCSDLCRAHQRSNMSVHRRRRSTAVHSRPKAVSRTQPRGSGTPPMASFMIERGGTRQRRSA